ncbi:DUF1983 domain-containing protein [Brenneria corticis]|uniref:Uncharacterized protein n=1 Tax=Brenneria corticis TaxID=2173106 RepID=A0A2U1TJV8_9GAMM|nr:DUF1983 domain-containing protein [Brenneria sp. CFCC 11842]PWC09649.1 hypothetical protein DDT56_23500 [Brenneria sp. CFCC 11842]
MATKWNSGTDSSSVAENMQTLTGQRGDGSQRAVTYADLASLGLANLQMLGGKAKLTPGGGGGSESSNSKVQTPTRPTGFGATGGFAYILLEWDMPLYTGRSLTEIYRYPEDNLANAVLIATTAAGVYGDPVDPATGYYYWIRHVNINGKPGPYNDSVGTYAETHADPAAIVEMVQEQLNQSPLIAELVSKIGENEQGISALDADVAALTQTATELEQIADDMAAGIDVRNAEVDQRFDTVEATANAAATKASVTELSQTVATQNSAMGQRVDTVEATANAAATKASVTELSQTVATQNSAMGQRVDTVEATANAAATKASVTELSQTVATQNSAMGQRVDTVEATANAASSAAQTNATAIATLDGVKAMWTAKTQAGQISAGIGIVANSDGTSQVAVAANQFFIFDPNNPNDDSTYAIPFAVVDGKVVLDQLIAQDAVVKILAAQTITADTVKVGATLTAVNIKSSTIENGGFTVDALGNATFGQLVIISATGQITIRSALTGRRMIWTNGLIQIFDDDNFKIADFGIW